MTDQLKLEKIADNPLLTTLLNNPEEITDSQWQELSELNYKEFISSPKESSLSGDHHINLVEFLCAMGLINSLLFLETKEPALLKNMVFNRDGVSASFIFAAQNGHLEVLNHLNNFLENYFTEIAPNYNFKEFMITPPAGGAWHAFIMAAGNAHLDVMKYLEEQFLEKHLPTLPKQIIRDFYYSAYLRSAQNNQLEVMKYLANIPLNLLQIIPDLLQIIIKTDGYNIFLDATKNGRLGVMQHLAEVAPELLQDMVKNNNYKAFQVAAQNGRLEVMQYLEKIAPDLLQNMIGADDYAAFRLAAQNGQLAVIQHLADIAPDLLQNMIEANNYAAFRLAAENGHLEVLRLAEKEPDLPKMIKAYNYAAFHDAVKKNHVKVWTWLLQDPECFAYADNPFNQYSQNVNLFIENTLSSLRQEVDAYLNETPNGAFDLENQNRVIHCFYMIKNLIRRNDRALDDDIRFLLTIPAVNALAHDNDNELLKLAISEGNKQAASMLLNIEEVVGLTTKTDLIDRDYLSYCKAFHPSASNSNLEMAKCLEEKAPILLQHLIESNDYQVFRDAAKNGHLEVLKYLAEKKPDLLQTMIETQHYEAFRSAVENRHLEVLTYLTEKAPTLLYHMLAAVPHFLYTFKFAVQDGHPEIATFLLQHPDNLAKVEESLHEYAHIVNPFVEETLSKFHQEHNTYLSENPNGVFDLQDQNRKRLCFYMIKSLIRRNDRAFDDEIRFLLTIPAVKTLAHANNNELLKLAISEGNKQATSMLLDIEEVMDLTTKKDLIDRDYLSYGKALYPSASNSDLGMAKFLETKAPKLLEHIIESNNYQVLEDAAKNGHLVVLKYFAETPNLLLTMNRHNRNAFRYAVENHHLEILTYLMEKVPTLLYHMLETVPQSQFGFAVQDGHHEIAKLLLQHPGHLAYAEMHVHEYAHIINPFIADTLSMLHQEHDTYLSENPNGVFDLQDQNRVSHCFYMIRNLIRRNDRDLDDEIRFLLTIPAVKTLAHANNNELLKVALRQGNQEAARMLLNIAAVRRIAEENNYYGHEARGIDVRQLAQDRESSMVALTQGEAKKLEAAINLYQPIIKTTGIDSIMEDLRNTLIELYEKEPCKIIINNEPMTLPTNYQDLQALKLNRTDYEKALKAYYQHPAHTALRYLSKPNYWMDPKASYVYINDNRTERWATFEEYQPLIAMYYLAAIDKDSPPTDGYTLETRLAHFINELALIGRAHNWDRTRRRTDGRGEEYDDGQGDKPSCYSGVNRRLSQSVRGHTLFDILTEEKIENELMQFAFGHFEPILTSNKEALKDIFKKIEDEEYLILDKTEEETLLGFNIPEDKQNNFIAELGKKYGAQFSENPDFITQVHQALHIDSKSDNPYNRYHVLNSNLFNTTNLYVYLNKTQETTNASNAPSMENNIKEQEQEPKAKAAPPPSSVQSTGLKKPTNVTALALNKAYASRNLETFKMLLRIGANPNSYYTPEKKETLMHRACRDNKIEFIKAMLETNRVEFTQDSSRRYPLDIAKDNSSGGTLGIYGLMSSGPSLAKEIVRLITDYEANPQDDLGLDKGM